MTEEEEEKAGQAEGHAFHLLKSEMISVPYFAF